MGSVLQNRIDRLENELPKPSNAKFFRLVASDEERDAAEAEATAQAFEDDDIMIIQLVGMGEGNDVTGHPTIASKLQD